MDGRCVPFLRLRLTKLPCDRPINPGTGSLREFHLAKRVRAKYHFDDSLYTSSGNVIFANIHAVRLFVQRVNDTLDLVRHPEQALRAGQVNAMGLIDEILHYVVHLYGEHTGEPPFRAAIRLIRDRIGDDLDDALLGFVIRFPPRDVHLGSASPIEYLNGETGGVANREVVLEELLLLWIANVNPAFAPYKELFDDADLKRSSAYLRIIEELYAYFSRKPFFGPDNQNLVDMLRSPAIAVPDSLPGQLRFIRERWGMLLGRFLLRLLGGVDLIKEEEKPTFGGAPGPTAAYTYGGTELEYERFSPDREWMPNVVLLAKSTLVWLDQLSKRYGRPIARLDQIPDEELDLLASRGFTGLWLIGLWQRSRASRRIKQLCGNPDAEASAYSLESYEIASDLGGWEALATLRARCGRRGIRLASDMVPNHTGIDSRWIIEHPERFIHLPYPPFPSYTYNGENLSGVPGVGVYIEDHYFDKSDAAVTFKRVDFGSGDTRYIYHGNDGTHMPWNDTAQLNFLDPAVREAVIQAILHVARNFPIIRFDAAMTLAKRHIQRLWYPEPGSGGDIPSRAEHALSTADFDRAIPNEFWREVVDRVAAELPDTLLLAEAFWMMEGYFVRTLGMHRVYNSAFMNMLKAEENAKYRSTIKNTLEFDPEILKRFVNFMNNPDEETAVAQFGKGDKYVGVCTMMVTMPGLPMFGHGQIEGFAEKYGMEYRRAYWNETPDAELVRRHDRELFPLMKKRSLFAEVAQFRLYDFFGPSQTVNENVFAYSNRSGDDRAIVLYNNRIDRTSGWLNWSVPFAERDGGGGKRPRREQLAAALGLQGGANRYTILTEQRSDLSYIRSSSELWERGMHAELSGYECQVFIGIREVQDNDLAHYRKLMERLGGKGTADIDAALKEIFLEPVHLALARFLQPRTLSYLVEDGSDLALLSTAYREFLIVGCEFSGGSFDDEIIRDMERAVRATREIITLARGERSGSRRTFTGYLGVGFELDPYAPHLLVGWALLKHVGSIVRNDTPMESRSLIDEWSLGGLFATAMSALGAAPDSSAHSVRMLKILTRYQGWFRKCRSPKEGGEALIRLFSDPEGAAFLGVNRYEETLWFNREAYLDLAWWLFAAAAIGIYEDYPSSAARSRETRRLLRIVRDWLAVLDESQYRVETLAASLRALQKSKRDATQRRGE